MGRACENTHVPQNVHQWTAIAKINKMLFPLDTSLFSLATYFYSNELKYKIPKVAGITVTFEFKLVVIFDGHSDCPPTT